jgi:hypothetical protein
MRFKDSLTEALQPYCVLQRFVGAMSMTIEETSAAGVITPPFETSHRLPANPVGGGQKPFIHQAHRQPLHLRRGYEAQGCAGPAHPEVAVGKSYRNSRAIESRLF